ncbi:hypothetical protein NQ317_005728 [Molorchus minor]|uniref:Uncharacterized protein n=1 Tax=Molorchus minor TaxID=1323400 RepID=A0ABQ9IRE2_9CUCU|nr:hypothetical protein NQ317_005728 [Molorchus minor]
MIILKIELGYFCAGKLKEEFLTTRESPSTGSSADDEYICIKQFRIKKSVVTSLYFSGLRALVHFLDLRDVEMVLIFLTDTGKI